VDSEYDVKESSDFQKYYKHVRKKYKHSFDEDFATVIKVITKKLVIEKGKYLNTPNTKPVHGLGSKVTHPVAFTRIQIKQARDMCGRVVYLVDNDKKRIFLIDVYYKSDRDNPNTAIVSKAYYEYLAILEEESKANATQESEVSETESKER